MKYYDGKKLYADIINLNNRAKDLRLLLESYAASDEDAGAVLGFMSSIFSDIESGRVIPPMRYEFSWHFFSTESTLFKKYSDLGEAAAQCSKALELWGRQEGRLG